jgi:hypothetical protein
MFNVITPCIPSLGVPYFGLLIPFHYSPLPLYLPHPNFSSAFIRLSCVLYLHMLQDCNFTDGLSFPFLFPLALSSIHLFCYFHMCSVFE